jgi:hypothetical protein
VSGELGGAESLVQGLAGGLALIAVGFGSVSLAVICWSMLG